MRFDEFIKRAVCRRLLHRRIYHALLAGGVRDEGEVFRDVFAPVEALLDILTDTLFERAAILFANAHLPLAHFDTGLEVQEVRAERSHSGAAPALSHVVEPLNEEACLHLRRKRAHALGDLAAGKPLRGELCRRHDQKSLPAAQVFRIDHIDIVELLRGKAGVLIAAGEIRADGDLHHRVVFLRIAREHFAVFVLADCRRAAKAPAAVHMGKNIRRRDVHTVLKFFSVLDDAQRRNGNIVAFEQLW